MLTAIDHLVIAVPDLAAAIKTYRDLGFSVVPGGRHTGVGTDNALIVFRDASYLELVGFYEPRPDHRWWAPLQQGGGLVDFCLQTTDLPGDAAVLREAGVDLGAPEPRHRMRPDGVEVRWTCVLARGAHRGVAPFVLGVPGQDLACPELGAVGARFVVGPHVFEFLAPTGAGPIRAWLNTRGASPYAATLVGAPRAVPLDLGRTWGARLALA